MMKADQTSGSGLVASGDKYVVCAAGVTTNVKAAPGRIVRIIPQSGTGTVQVNDNATGATTGATLWPATAQVLGAAGIIPLDCPATTGIAVTCAATTTCVVVYS